MNAVVSRREPALGGRAAVLQAASGWLDSALSCLRDGHKLGWPGAAGRIAANPERAIATIVRVLGDPAEPAELKIRLILILEAIDNRRALAALQAISRGRDPVPGEAARRALARRQPAMSWLTRCLRRVRVQARLPWAELEWHLLASLAAGRPGDDARPLHALRAILRCGKPGMAQLFAFCAETATYTARIMQLLSGIAQDPHDPEYDAAIPILLHYSIVKTRSG